MKHTIFILALLLSVLPSASGAQNWSTQFGSPPTGSGLNGTAYALVVYDDMLIAAGVFTQAGPIAANKIAAWDGTQWHALGSGITVSGGVRALTEYNGDLIAAGGQSAGFLMRWDGTSWSPIPPPPNDGYFWSVCPYGGSLFVNSQEAGVSKLARWDGANWESILMPTNPLFGRAYILAMTTHNGQLFMTGEAAPWDFFLFSWDGNAFGGPGFSADALPSALYVYHDLLYVGGDWYPHPPFYDDGIAIWDESKWIPFGLSPGAIFAMGSYHGRLVLGGVGVTSFNGISNTGQNEQWLGGGCSFTMWVRAVQEFQGDLYVAGTFHEICTESSQLQAYNFAKWSEPVTAVSPSSVLPSLRIDSAPNPFNPSVALTIRVPAKSQVTVTISDARGRIVRHVASSVQNAGPYRVSWNGVGDSGEKLASGVYFARVIAGTRTATSKLVLLK